jgi:hypothetical protein
MIAEATALPGKDCGRFDDDEGVSPVGPDPTDPRPQDAVAGPKPRALNRSLVDRELMAKSEDLQLHGRSGAAGRGDPSDQGG